MPLVGTRTLFALSLLALLGGCRGASPVALPNNAAAQPLTPIDQGHGRALVPLVRAELHLDGATGEATLRFPDTREAAILGERTLFDLTRAVRGGFGPDALRVTQLRQKTGNRIGVTLSLTHPFALPDLLQPASGTNRLDLHLFGLHVLALSDSTGVSPLTGITVDPDLITNAQGFTSAFPPTVTGTTTNAHPYRVFMTDDPANLGPGNFDPLTGYTDLMAPVGYNIFPQGATATTELDFRLAPGETRTIDLLFAAHFIDATADDTLDRLPDGTNGPKYFAPAGAGSAPWAMLVGATTSGLTAATPGGQVDLTIAVADWQYGLPADAEYSDIANLSGLPEQSTVVGVQAFLPGLSSAAASTSTPTNAGSATGFADAPVEFALTLQNDLGAIGGTYVGIVEVLDDATPGTNTDDPNLQNVRGKVALGPRFDLTTLNTFQIFTVVVPPGTQPPVVALDAPSEVRVGEAIILDATRACDPDGVIVRHEWDFAYDGTFEADSRTTAATVTIGAPVTCESSSTPFSIAVRVIDNDGFASAFVCTDPAEGSTFEPETCVVSGDLPRTCASIVVLPREGLPAFGVEVNASGAAITSAPFADTRSPGQHAIAIDGDLVYVAYHAVSVGFKTGNVFVARSENGGATFGTPVNLSNIPAPVTTPGTDPDLTVANNISLCLDPEGHPVVVYARGLILNQDIRLQRSTDRGATFGNPLILTRQGNQGQPSVLITPDNATYVAFADWAALGGDRIVVARGASGSSDLALDSINDITDDTGMTVTYRTDFLVSQTSPALVYHAGPGLDPSVVVTWSDAAAVGNDRARILADSTALGAFAFGTDLRVGPAPSAGSYQFEPSPAVDSATGRLAIAYRESHAEGSFLASDVFLARAAQSALPTTFAPSIQVSDSTNLPRYTLAPSLAIAPGGDTVIAWQSAPTGDLSNYDIALDHALDGLTFGIDDFTTDDEETVDEHLVPEHAFNPMLATNGCRFVMGWAGPNNPTDTNNTWSIFVDVGT